MDQGFAGLGLARRALALAACRQVWLEAAGRRGWPRKMSRGEYLVYVARRVLESAAVAACAAWLTRSLQLEGWLPAPFRGPGPYWRPAPYAQDWLVPIMVGLAAQVLFGPKQRKPIYLRVRGAMFTFAGVAVSRQAGCRGGCTLGSTGSGKTLSCILPRLHSLCVNEAGRERPGWRRSREAKTLRALQAQCSALEARVRLPSGPRGTGDDAPRLRLEAARALLQSEHERSRRLRYESPPWGGLVIGEKGNEWMAVQELLASHGRALDLCVIRTNPDEADRGWRPAVRLNLLSLNEVSPDTYAAMLVETSRSVEEPSTRDEFFVPQARDKIAWGLRLLRAARNGAASTADPDGEPPASPDLCTLLRVLTSYEEYMGHVSSSLERYPALSGFPPFAEARHMLEANYWSQPADQLGGVRSTIYNYLVPFADREMAEVFSRDSTFDLRDIANGTVVCVAIPQRLWLQRRYVSTLLKLLTYHIILKRFDQREAGAKADQNVIVVEQDEWQRHVVQADCDVDVVREANGAVFASAQSINAVWSHLGGREAASPLISNLRNRWVCQAATQECAEESSAHIGTQLSAERSISRGDNGRSISTTERERPLLPASLLRSLPPFHVAFSPSEGRWAYRLGISMPANPDGSMPRWWLGDWNLIPWIARAAHMPERILGLRLHGGSAQIPPWRAAAPVRAHIRWLLGLDGTFILLRARARGRKTCSQA